jgi:hypothetical protein
MTVIKTTIVGFLLKKITYTFSSFVEILKYKTFGLVNIWLG